MMSRNTNWFWLGCLFIPILLLITACDTQQKLKEVTRSKLALGTIIKITVLDTNKVSAQKAIERAYEEIERIGSLFYEKNPESAIYKLNHSENDTIFLPEEIIDWIWRSQEIGRKTKGRFDITIGRLTETYNFEEEKFTPPSQSQIDSLLNYVGFDKIKIDTGQNFVIRKDKNLKILTGGSAKGYAVDRAISILDSLNLAGALISAGGDIRVLPRQDNKKWTVGIRNPRDTKDLLGRIKLDSGAVATSGDYEQYANYNNKRYHHIINPITGLPAWKSRSTTIIAPTAELADALSTGLFILGPGEGKQQIESFPESEALWIDSTGSYHKSKEFTKYIDGNIE